MNENGGEEIRIDCEMLTPVNKIVAMAQMFKCAAKEELEGFDESGFMGIGEILDSVATEIMDIAHKLNNRIKTRQGGRRA
jgi:hypothetical protein